MKREPTIGFIGLGAMGLPIARNLNESGYKMRIYTRTWKDHMNGIFPSNYCCKSAEEVSRQSQIIIICVSDDDAVESIIFKEKGLLPTLQKGTIIIDFSTISPAKARDFANRLNKSNISYLDAPLSGGTEGAVTRKLTIFVGGEKASFNKIIPILKTIGKSIYHFGPIGSGQEVKAINQILVAGTYAALAEAISTGERLGLPMEDVVKAIKGGAANSWALEHRSENMIRNNYPLGFKLKLHRKDLKIALELAESQGLNLPITSKVLSLEENLIHNGYENHDISVLKVGVETINQD